MSEFSTSARNSRSRITHPKSKRILRIIKIEDDEDEPVQTERSRSRSISPLRKIKSTRFSKFRSRRPPCRDYYGKGYCLRGYKCKFNHGAMPIVVNDSMLEKIKESPIFNPNPSPPGLENSDDEMVVEEQRNQQLQSLIGMAFTTGGFEASQNIVQLNNGCYLPEFVNQSTSAMQTSSNYLYNYNNIPSPTQPALTAQPETLENEVKGNAPSIEELAVVQPLQPLLVNDDRNEKDTKLLQLSRLKGELYEKLVEQQKSLLLKLKDAEGEKTKKQLKELIKRVETLMQKTKDELQELFNSADLKTKEE
uniref:C3H1-type domain-containing protein n=1 Tax=Meloidogyne javanica TaxID=6303 RepID=A0A915MT89_MELJA